MRGANWQSLINSGSVTRFCKCDALHDVLGASFVTASAGALKIPQSEL